LENSHLAGKTALVTGASKGIGRAIALMLAGQGAKVGVNYNTSAEAAEEVVSTIAAKGGEAVAVQADVSRPEQVNDMVARVSGELGDVDVMVNNAGIIDDGLLMRMSDEAWPRVIETNLNGTFYCTRAVLRAMVRNRWGRIINIGSVTGVRGSAGQANYSASKAGIIGLTKALAKEVATRNVTVNTVTPGYFETDTTADLTEKQKDYWLSIIPQGRFGEVDDVANLVAFLADDRSKYITGQVISVDGGMAV